MRYALVLLGALLQGWSAVSATASLVVTDGAQGVATAPGAVNHVWADPAGDDRVFDRWAGDVHVLDDPFAWHTLATIPVEPAEVRAIYRAAPPWTPVTHQLDPGVRLRYHVPERPRGVILMFHGGGGSANVIDANHEVNQLAREAVARGFAVAALDSSDRDARQWNPSPDAGNPDVVNVERSIRFLRDQGLVDPGAPVFGVGASNGGGFAPKPARWLGFAGVAIYIGSGQTPEIFEQTQTPTLWHLAERDPNLNFLPNALERKGILDARGIATELRVHPPSPLHAERLLRVPGLSAADAELIFDTLAGGGFLDAHNNLLSDPLSSGWEALLPARLSEFRNDVRDQLDIAWAGHNFYAEYNHFVLDFFEARIPEPAHAAAIAAAGVLAATRRPATRRPAARSALRRVERCGALIVAARDRRHGRSRRGRQGRHVPGEGLEAFPARLEHGDGHVTRSAGVDVLDDAALARVRAADHPAARALFHFARRLRLHAPRSAASFATWGRSAAQRMAAGADEHGT